MPIQGPEIRRGPQDGGVTWAIDSQTLEAAGLPETRLWKSRALVADVDGHEIGVGIFAIPPTEPRISKFWTSVRTRLGMPTEPKLPPTRLKIEEPVPMDEFQRGDHTRLSAIHPYVVMEHETNFGIGVWLPRDMIGEWSEPQSRTPEGRFSMGETEIFRQRESVALLIRLDGDTPLAEQNITGVGRQEILIGVPEPEEGSEGDIRLLAAKRQVVGKGASAKASDLQFNVLSERGTDDNAQIDNKGRVQVVVAKIVDDEVIERVHKPLAISEFPSGDLGTRGMDNLTYGGLRGGGIYGKGLSETRDSHTRDATLRGETQFTNTRREKVSVNTVRNVQPIAEFNMVLVGNGGPITAEMSEAPTST